VVQVPDPEHDKLEIELSVSTALPGGVNEIGSAKIGLKDLVMQEEMPFDLGFDDGSLSITLTARDFGKEKKKKKGGEKPKTKPKKKKVPAPQGLVRPSDEEVLKLFEDIRSSANISTEMAKNMTIESKWILYTQFRSVKKNEGDQESPETFLQLLRDNLSVENIDKIKFGFVHHTISWLNKWNEIGGIAEIVGILKKTLRKMKKEELSDGERDIKEHLIEALYKFTNNNPDGLQQVSNTKEAIRTLYQFLYDPTLDDDIRYTIYTLLSVFCLFPESHSRVMAAMDYYREQNNEEHRFGKLLELLSSSKSAQLQVSILTFINAATFAPTDIDLRVQIKQELSSLNYKDITDKLTEHNEDHDSDSQADIEKQVNIFEEHSEDDKKALKKRFKHIDEIEVDKISNPEELYNRLKKLLNKNELNQFFTELLGDIAGINPFDDIGPAKWALISRVARQISLIEKINDEGKETFDKLIKNIQQFDVKPIWPLAQKIDFLQKEKEKLEQTVDAVKNKLKEIEDNKSKEDEAKLQVQVLNEKLNELKTILKLKQDTLTSLEGDIKRLSDEKKN